MLRGSQYPFINKELSKAIMTRIRLKKKLFKNQTEENRNLYTQHGIYNVSLLRQTKRKFYSSISEKDVIEHKTFRKTIKRIKR